MRVALILLPALVLALPATAHAGGWATVQVDPPPAGLGAGEPWRAELLIKQHGITPMTGLKPRVRIADDAGVVREFPARPAGRPGVYVAEVTYPSPGTWRTRFFDGFTDVVPHRLAPLAIGPATPSTAATADAGGIPPQAIAIAVVALAWLAAMVALRERGPARGRRRPASRAVAGGPAPGP